MLKVLEKLLWVDTHYQTGRFIVRDANNGNVQVEDCGNDRAKAWAIVNNYHATSSHAD